MQSTRHIWLIGKPALAIGFEPVALTRRVRPVISASRAASRRNPGVCLFPFPIEHLLLPQLVLSTFPGQVQDA